MTNSERQLARVTGAISILIGLAGLVVVAANRQTRLNGGRDVSIITPWAVGFFLLGIASVVGQRWAAIVLAAGFGVLGLVLTYGAVFEVPFPGMLFNMLLAVVLLLPALLLLRSWRRGRNSH